MSETTFSHQKANSPDANYSDGGLRSFFVYRDTGVNAATKGKMRVDKELDWDASADFGKPGREQPKPLNAWEKYAQVLMLSNELVFVD